MESNAIGTNGTNGTNGFTGHWLVPDMTILRRNSAPVPDFPLHIFGPEAGPWVMHASAAKSAPIDYVGLCLLVGVAGLVGARRSISPWADWKQPLILWGALVGSPSSRKSPALDPVRAALQTVERETNTDVGVKLAEHDQQVVAADAERDLWRAKVKTAPETKNPSPGLPPSPCMPERPVPRRIFMVDTTTEKLLRILAADPGGLLIYRDELSGFFGSFDRYKNGKADRPFWLECFEGYQG